MFSGLIKIVFVFNFEEIQVETVKEKVKNNFSLLYIIGVWKRSGWILDIVQHVSLNENFYVVNEMTLKYIHFTEL